mgnify:CR=1 FL=1
MVSPDEDERIDMQTAESAVPIDVGGTSETFHPAIMRLFMGFEALMRTLMKGFAHPDIQTSGSASQETKPMFARTSWRAKLWRRPRRDHISCERP